MKSPSVWEAARWLVASNAPALNIEPLINVRRVNIAELLIKAKDSLDRRGRAGERGRSAATSARGAARHEQMEFGY
jgi:hypothetical protein